LKYQVIKSFVDLGNITRNIGDIIEVDGHRVGKLLQYRLIGLVKETAVKEVEVEKAVIEVIEIKEEVKEVVKEVVKEEEKPKKRR
jgi:hypothetical protein